MSPNSQVQQTSLFCERLIFLVGHPVPHTYVYLMVHQITNHMSSWIFKKIFSYKAESLLESIIVSEKLWASTFRVKNLCFQSTQHHMSENVIPPQFSLSNFKCFLFCILFHLLFICQKGMFQLQRQCSETRETRVTMIASIWK